MKGRNGGVGDAGTAVQFAVITLKSGRQVRIALAPQGDALNVQLQAFLAALQHPEISERFFVFRGQMLAVVACNEVAAVTVVERSVRSAENDEDGAADDADGEDRRHVRPGKTALRHSRMQRPAEP